MALCWLFRAMLVCSALLKRHVAEGCHRSWCGVPQLLIHSRSASVAEPGTRRSDEEQLWEAAGILPFTRARIGSFFQERPVLKNPFLEDSLLRGYLRRHLPQEVNRMCLSSTVYLIIYYSKCLFLVHTVNNWTIAVHRPFSQIYVRLGSVWQKRWMVGVGSVRLPLHDYYTMIPGVAELTTLWPLQPGNAWRTYQHKKDWLPSAMRDHTESGG